MPPGPAGGSCPHTACLPVACQWLAFLPPLTNVFMRAARCPRGPPACRKTNGVCPITSGQQTIDSLDLDQLSIVGNAGVLLAYIVVCRLAAFLGIRYIKW